jgi:hypothetical protein
MRKAMLAGYAVVLLFTGAVLAADSYGSIIKELSETMKDLAATLKTVKDSDTAKAAMPKLKTINAKGNDLSARMQKLGKPTKEEEALLQKFIDESMATGKDIEKEATRLKSVKGAEEVIKLMEEQNKK